MTLEAQLIQRLCLLPADPCSTTWVDIDTSFNITHINHLMYIDEIKKYLPKT